MDGLERLKLIAYDLMSLPLPSTKDDNFIKLPQDLDLLWLVTRHFQQLSPFGLAADYSFFVNLHFR